MLTLNDTSLETFSFGNSEDDKYYILINIQQNPDGINIQKLASADPRVFDSVLNEMGCILMLTGFELTELRNRREIDLNNLHESLFQLAKQEGIIP
tara:strand:+ start:55897 stop:56184 length:288 start_codon:yes stop_codon:yes gene_type:complete